MIITSSFFGRQLIAVYGYQQREIDDLTEDLSSWWLVFDGDSWLTVESVIAPAFVSPMFVLRYRCICGNEAPSQAQLRDHERNPVALVPLLGLRLIEVLDGISDELQDHELRLGFGTGDVVTHVLRIGYLDDWKDGCGPGMGAAIAIEEN